MEETSKEIRIKELKPGEKGVVTGYEKDAPVYRNKLITMGLTKGTEVKLLKIAPMGDPVELEIRGFKLSLRKAEADVLKLERIV